MNKCSKQTLNKRSKNTANTSETNQRLHLLATRFSTESMPKHRTFYTLSYVSCTVKNVYQLSSSDKLQYHRGEKANISNRIK